MKGVCHVEVNDYSNLILKEEYKVLLTLPSYVVIQHPKTFHTVLYACKRSPRTTEWVRKYLDQYNIPGLASDVNVSIPAGMWQEWLKKTKNSNAEPGYVDFGNYPTPPPPQPTLAYQPVEDVVNAAATAQQELYNGLRANLQTEWQSYTNPTDFMERIDEDL